MIFRIIFLLIILLGIFWLLKRLKNLPATQRKKAYLTLTLWGAIALLVIGVVTGRMHWLGMLFAFLLGAAKLGMRFLPIIKLIGARSPFSNPVFNTPNLTCSIDLKSGELKGEIKKGEFSGRALSSLTTEEIISLREQYQQEDKRAYYLLFVLLQQQGAATHNENQKYEDVDSPSIQEAIQILGVSNNYTKKDVIDAHRKLIQKLHPDRGGNDYLASRVNLAKSILLESKKNN